MDLYTKKSMKAKSKYLQYEVGYKKVKNYLDNEKPNDGINYFVKIQKELGENTTEDEQLVISILLCILLNKTSRIAENLTLIETLDGKITDPLMIIDFTITKAETLLKIGSQQKAFDLLEIIEDQIKIVKNQCNKSRYLDILLDREGYFYNLQGVIKWFLGDVLGALDAFQESLRLRETLGNKKYLASSLNNLGSIYTYQGELHASLELYVKALKILENLPHKTDLATTYSNIGEFYHYMGNYELATDFYEQAEVITETIDNPIFQARCYYQILVLHIEYNEIQKAQVYLEKIKLLDTTVEENTYIHTLFLLSEGFILKRSSSLMKKFKAGENFLQIANNTLIDSELTVQAIFNLNDILLLEIRLSGNEENLKEIKKWFSKVISLAESQKSPILIIQTLILDSKLKLLDFNVQEATEVLVKAYQIANQKGLMRFKESITEELEKIKIQEKSFEDLRTQGASLIERIEFTGLESTLNNLIKKRLDSPELINLMVRSIKPSVKNAEHSEKKNDKIVENFHRILSNETYITLYRQFTMGPEIYLTDELHFSKLNKTILETKMGIYFMTAIGQGGNSNEGLYGPLPFPDEPDYESMIYSFFMNDSDNSDPRYNGKSYCLFVITFPKKFELYYANRHYLTKVFVSFLTSFDKLQDIDIKSIDDLKLKLIK